MAATMRDIARILGVSQATVSYVLNNKEGTRISASTRRLILESARRLNYIPNAAARALVSGKANAIGLFYPRFGEEIASDPQAARIVKGIDKALTDTDSSLLLYIRNGSEETPDIRSILDGRAAGLIVIAPHIASRLIRQLERMDFPSVIIGSPDLQERRVVTVDTDVSTGAMEAVSYLISRGHRRIAHIAGPLSSANSERKIRGYRQALTEAGIVVSPDLILEGDFSRESGRKMADRLLDLPSPPTAVFAANDLMAIGAMERLKERRKHIPQDVALIGYDDTPLATVVAPSLTSVRPPAEEVGAAAARLLLQMVEGRMPAECNLLVPPRLIVRESCCSLTAL